MSHRASARRFRRVPAAVRTPDTPLRPVVPRPVRPAKRPLPHLCAADAHQWHFHDRAQLGLPGDAEPGAYPLAVYLHCARCVAVVQFLGACDPAQGATHLESAWLLLPDGRGWQLPHNATRVVLVPHG